ncbi:HlyD family efflux transporter periplasmic adaptor subunit [bacterium]|jgi:macrolide-specific efflux system membrane fusion protein|nr:HlyD family efflux transporter periplasmic adaptor subunit [bacterium]
MSRKILKIIIVLGVLAAAAFFLPGFIKENNSDMEKTSEFVKPFYGDIKVAVSTTGVVEPQNRLEIKPPIAGRVDEILVEEGQSVKTGDILALMSSTERAALLDSARLKGETEMEYWQEVYKAAPLIAPIDGKVIVRSVEPGQTVTTGDAVIVLSDRLIVQADVDETDVGKINLGQKAVVSLDAYPEIKVNAVVDHISYESKVVNNVTIYEVDILPESIPEVFRSGMSANVDVIVAERKNVMLIPAEAVTAEGSRKTVTVKNEKTGEIKTTDISAGLSDSENIEVLSGLKEDDTVLVKNGSYRPPQKKSVSSPFMPPGRKGKK